VIVLRSLREPWADLELQELYEVINDTDWFDTCRPFLPHRSDAAIHTKMCQLRREAGIVPNRIGPKSISQAATEREKARQGCNRLRDAILEAA
jgi:hypothetical protein